MKLRDSFRRKTLSEVCVRKKTGETFLQKAAIKFLQFTACCILD